MSIEIRHEYFTNNICSDIKLLPTPSTEYCLKQYNIQLKQNNNNHFLLADQDFDVNQVTSESLIEKDGDDSDEAKLEFLVVSTRDEFWKITQAPLKTLGLLYFSTEHQKEDNGDILLISEHKSDEEVSEVIAKIGIELSALLESSRSGAVAYKINFKARAVVWKYYIIDQGNNGFITFKLTGQDDGLFSADEEVDLTNGQKAKLISSGENKIALHEQSTIQVGLQGRKGDGTTVVLINQLPTADPMSLKEDGKDLAACIYVYV